MSEEEPVLVSSGELIDGITKPFRNRIADLERQIKGYQSECREVEQTLGRALGCPRFCDDQNNFPGSTNADGVCVGEHTPATIATEAARRIADLNREARAYYDEAAAGWTNFRRAERRIAELTLAIEKAPHQMSCLSRAEWATLDYCDCWKRDVLRNKIV